MYFSWAAWLTNFILICLDLSWSCVQVRRPSGTLTGPCRCLLPQAPQLRRVPVAPSFSTTERGSVQRRAKRCKALQNLQSSVQVRQSVHSRCVYQCFAVLIVSEICAEMHILRASFWDLDVWLLPRRELSLWPKNATGLEQKANSMRSHEPLNMKSLLIFSNALEETEYQIMDFRIKQAELWREDVRDIIGLTSVTWLRSAASYQHCSACAWFYSWLIWQIWSPLTLLRDVVRKLDSAFLSLTAGLAVSLFSFFATRRQS